MSTEAPSKPALQLAPPPLQSGYVRVAVVQIAYHPAALHKDKDRSLIEDPLFDPNRGDSLLPDKPWSVPEALKKELRELRRRVRAAYNDQLRRRLETVLEFCAQLGVRLVVLPEYSVPFDLLEQVARAVRDVVIVAGTHSVERDALRKVTPAETSLDGPTGAMNVYQRLGAPSSPQLMESVCPVLHDGKLLALQPKLNPAAPERDFLRRGDRWTSVTLPENVPGPLGVLICLDFLFRESPAYREHVASQLDGCRFLAVPSLTPDYSLPEFSAQATTEARRRGKPVLYSNIASDGGTSIYIDEKESARPFPEGPGVLAREDEGVIIADLWRDLVPPGKSTRHDEPRLLLPVAAASLVYQALPREREYWIWIEELSRIAGAEDELEALEAISAHVRGAEVLLQSVGLGGIRRERLVRLRDEVDSTASAGRMQQLVREAVLPPEVLPLRAVRAALALGAADVVRELRDRYGLEAAELADVERRLRHESGMATWAGEQALLAEGRKAFEAVSEAVRGSAPPHREREVLVAQVQAYAEAAMKGFEAEQREAQAAFDAGKFEEARPLFQTMLTRAEGLLDKDPGRADLRQWVARCRLNVSACSLNLQEVEPAVDLLRRIDAADLSSRGRCTLAECLAYTGDLDAARSVLPEERESDAVEDRERLGEVRQILTLLAGEMPVEELRSTSAVQRHAAELLLERQDLDGAARHALQAMKAATAQEPLTKATVLSILIAALKRSIHEQPSTARVIDAEIKPEVVTRIEQELAVMRFEALPSAVRRQLRAWQRLYYGLVADRAALEALQTSPEDPEPQVDTEFEEQRARVRAGQLAQEGRLAEALDALPPVEHPWLGRFQRAQLAALAGRKDLALVEALELAQETPGKAPVEHLAAGLLHQEGRHEEALLHAESAFQALPGKGQRLLRAQCLLDVGRAAEAWALLAPLREESEPGILVLLAQAADVAAPREAPERWARYLHRRPEDVAAKVRRAQALYKVGERAQAAEIAWEALSAHGEVLAAEAIFTAASLQVLHGEVGEHARERLEHVVALLRRRFPGDPQAEFFRSQILMLLPGAAAEVEPIDWDLIEGAGLVEALPAEEVIERLRHGRAIAEEAYRLYRMGALPFASLCKVSGIDAPTMVLQLVRRARATQGALCAPVEPGANSLISLEGAELLLSDLELYLLQILELLPRLREALGARGRVVMLAETERRLFTETSNLRAQIGPVQERLKRCERVLGVAARLPKHEQGLPLVQGIPPRALLQQLFAEGRIGQERLAALLANLPPEDTLAWPEPAPERFGVTADVLLWFAEADALEALVEAFPGGLLVDPEAPARLTIQRERLAEELEAVHLADRVELFVAQGSREGWLTLLDPPAQVPALPALKEGFASEEVVRREPLRALLVVRAAQREHAGLWRLTADFFGRSALGHMIQVQGLAWPDTKPYLELSKSNRKAAARDLHLPALVRLLVPGARADEKLLRLAELGFTDALGAGEIARLSLRYGGLAKSTPQRYLDWLEWMARDPAHLGGEKARLQLAQTYAETIWTAFCGGKRESASRDAAPREASPRTPSAEPSVLGEAEASALTAELLRRAEALDEATGSAFLDQALLFAAVQACGRQDAFVRREGEMAVFDEDSRGSAVWRFLYQTWAKGNPGRRGALGRAVRETLATLDLAREAGPSLPEYAPLLSVMASQRATGSGGVLISLRDPEIEAAAILSAHWRESPLSSEGFEISSTTQGRQVTATVLLQELVMHGASLLRQPGDERLTGFNERTLRFLYSPRDLAASVHVEAPLEAVLLRAEVNVLGPAAGGWARYQGPHDGRAYRMLTAIARAPEDALQRRGYGRFTVSAPWRLIRDDPGFLLRWPAWRGAGGTMRAARLDDLRAMLSEPEGPLPEESLIGDLLAERAEPPDGIWSQRLDLGDLFFQASEVPGSLPALVAGSRVHLEDDAYAQQVAIALERLDHSAEHPIARLAGDLCFLRVAAAVKPQVRLPSGPIDLVKELPDRLLRLLTEVAAPPPPGTLAEAEGALLRVCWQVVRRLRRTESLPPRDHLWLTYRLFQWLCVQLAAIAPDARREGVSRLVQGAPPVEEQVEDLLDPRHFDPRFFEHRLATVLYAMAAMEELTRFAASRGEGGDAPPVAISSAAVEAKLAELASGPRRGLRVRSALEWNAPSKIPDLALLALLRRNQEGFLALPLEARLRWIETLPEAPEAADDHERELVRTIVTALADNVSSLDQTERAAFEVKLHAMDDSSTGKKLRWLGLGSLFGPDAPRLEEEARELLLTNLDDQPTSILLGSRFLSALSAIDLRRLEQEVEVLLARAAEHGEMGAGMILGALARVGLHGPVEARAPARELLGKLATRPAFRGDANLLQILRLLNIPEPTS